MIKILNVMYAMDGGGVEQLMYQYLSHMDRSGFQIDFAVNGKNRGMVEAALSEMGCTIHHITARRDNFKLHQKELEDVMRKGQYDIVHSHQNEKGFVTLRIAKKCGVAKRIIHCHNAFPPETAAQKALRYLGARLSTHYANHYFACGEDAGLWFYGERFFNAGKVDIIKNAIDLAAFAYREDVRREVRAELGASGTFIVGNVARMHVQKNHMLLLDIFCELHQKEPRTELWLIGGGELEEMIRERTKQLGLMDSVKFLGVRKDVKRLMQAIDCFVLPSSFEGLGIVYLEAQAAGLKTFGSLIKGARETKVTKLIELYPPGTCASIWADAIRACMKEGKREDVTAALRDAGYDIAVEAGKMAQRYKAICQG